MNQDFPWLRWWDSTGNLLLAGDELARQESLRAEQAFRRAEQESQRADSFACAIGRSAGRKITSNGN